MSHVETTRRTLTRKAAIPFSQEEVDRIESLAPRIRGELSAAVTRVRTGGESVLALSRKLGIDRNLCRRVVAGVRPGVSNWDLLEQLPGTEGLRMFALAAAKEISGKDVRSVLLSTVEQYESLVQDLGGSQTKFLQRLHATRQAGRGSPVAGGAVDNIDTRARLREAATELVGFDVSYLTSLTMVRPIPDSPELIELLQATGLIGLRPLRGPVTVVSRGYAMRKTAEELAVEQHARPLTADADGMGLVREFCSDPPPVCISEGSDGHARLVLDTDAHAPGSMHDVAIATHWSPGVNPMREQTEKWWYQVVSVRRPSRRLVFDVYLHRSMAASCVPTAAAFLWHPALTGDLARHWDDRLPGRVTIEMLGRSTLNAATDGWASHRRFVERVFELGGWTPDDFVGFRIDVAEPLWGASYFMSFDFSDSSAD